MARHFYDPGGQASSVEAARLATMAAEADLVSLTGSAASLIVTASSSPMSALVIPRRWERRWRRGTHRRPTCRSTCDRQPSASTGRGVGTVAWGRRPTSPSTTPAWMRSTLRFVLAWLDPTGRRRAVEEMLRVSRGRARLVIIDYDWGSAAGPEVVEVWKQRLLRVLTGFGFDPYCGRQLPLDLPHHLTGAGLRPGDFTVKDGGATRTEPLSDALATITQTMAPVVERLEALDLDDDADELVAAFSAVVRYAGQHPDAPITFPAMAATTVELNTTAALATAASAIGRGRAARRRRATSRRLPSAGPPELGVHRLESADLIDQARRLHAAEYLQHGHATDEAIDSDGFLIAAIDPSDVIARSDYLGVVDDEGLVTACLRMIRPVRGDMTALPTLRKLLAQRRPHGLSELPFPTGSALFEVSGLAKSSLNRDRTAILRLLLATGCEASRYGDDFAVMGVVASTARLLMSVFGTQAIRPLDSSSTIAVDGVGIRPGGVRLVPCYSVTATFVNDLLGHCRARPDNELSRLNQPLIELTAAACASITNVA